MRLAAWLGQQANSHSGTGLEGGVSSAAVLGTIPFSPASRTISFFSDIQRIRSRFHIVSSTFTCFRFLSVWGFSKKKDSHLSSNYRAFEPTHVLEDAFFWFDEVETMYTREIVSLNIDNFMMFGYPFHNISESKSRQWFRVKRSKPLRLKNQFFRVDSKAASSSRCKATFVLYTNLLEKLPTLFPSWNVLRG